jgi:anti-anti-sigma regulatory factor
MHAKLDKGMYARPAVATRTLKPSAEPSGSVWTSVEQGHEVIWLNGEVDLTLAQDLDNLVVHARDLGFHTVLDCSQMMFCDCTVATFIAALSDQVFVTLRRPPSSLVDLLAMCDLTDRVQLAR